MNKVVFLDVDGVIADFMLHVLTMFGREDLNPPKQYQISKLLDIPYRQFWSNIDTPVFWRTVPVYPGAPEFVKRLYQLCELQGFELRFCTASGNSLCFPEHRTRWLREFCAKAKVSIPVVIAQSSEDKGCLAGPGTIFIDDNDVVAESVTAGGGHIVLVPQPWNSRSGFSGDGPDYELVLREVRRYMDEIDRVESLEDYAGDDHAPRSGDCVERDLNPAYLASPDSPDSLRIYC